MINPEYANVEIWEVAPPEVVNFPNAIFDNLSIGDHRDVIAAEKQSGADIAEARKGDLDDGEVILDAVMVSDGALLNRDGNDVPQVLQSIKEMLADRRNSIVRRKEVAMNEFEANDRLLTLSFPSLFMFGSGIKRPCLRRPFTHVDFVAKSHDFWRCQRRVFTPKKSIPIFRPRTLVFSSLGPTT